MGIDADFNFKKVAAVSLPNSKGNKKLRVKLKSSLDIDVALISSQTFTKCPKPTLFEKIFGKRYVVLQISNGGKAVLIKVNQESLRKRLGVKPSYFYDELKQNKDRDMTQFVQNVVEYKLKYDHYINNPSEIPMAPTEIKQSWTVSMEVVKNNPHDLNTWTVL